MLDCVRSRFDSSLDVKRLRVHGDFQSKRMRFLYGGFHFSLREMASKLDHIGTFVELFAHSLPPIVRAGGDSRRVGHANQQIGCVLSRMPSFGGDELSRRKDAWPRYAVLRDPLFQPERDVACRADVTNTGDATLQEVAQFFHGAQRRIRIADGAAKILLRFRVGQVGVQIDQTRKNRFVRYIDHARILGPIARARRENLRDLVALDDDRGFPHRRPRTVEKPPAAQHEGTVGPARAWSHRHAARVVRNRRVRIEVFSAVLESLLGKKDGVCADHE